MAWGRLLRLAAILETSLLAVAAITHLDREAAAISLLMGLATVLLFWRPNRAVVLATTLLFANVAFWMVTATVSNLETREGLAVIILPLALALTSFTGGISAATFLLIGRRRDGPQLAAAALALCSILAFATVAGLSLIEGGDAQAQHPGDIVLRMHNTAFSTRAIKATTGPLHLYVVNDDLFWHTVTSDRFGIDLKVPVGSHRRIKISAPTGTYTFYCRIPGHIQAGMKGTITIP